MLNPPGYKSCGCAHGIEGLDSCKDDGSESGKTSHGDRAAEAASGTLEGCDGRA